MISDMVPDSSRRGDVLLEPFVNNGARKAVSESLIASRSVFIEHRIRDGGRGQRRDGVEAGGRRA